MIDIIFGYVMLALLAVPVLVTIFMVPVVDWLRAREKRKKAEAAAKAAAGSASPSSTVASSTPEPA